MDTSFCKTLGIEFPLFAFTHCRDVVAAVSRAGGMGVLGAVGMTEDQLEEELCWIDKHVDGKPYGVDLIVPSAYVGKGRNVSIHDHIASLPDEQKRFAAKILEDRGIDVSDLDEGRKGAGRFGENLKEETAARMMEVAFSHKIGLIANALGVPPKIMLDAGRKRHVPVAALIGTREHALAQVQAGVDIVVAAGGEAGGHCGDIGTMVLVPDTVRALRAAGYQTPVLAAGGIVTGDQMAAAMAMGAAGAWTGSVWLTTTDAETGEVVKSKMLKASSRDTVRSRSRTGKYSRQLKSPWTDAWESAGAPPSLPMPLQPLVAEPALRKVDRLAAAGHVGAQELVTYWVGQGVGMMNTEMSASAVVQEFKEDFIRACERLNESLGA